MFPGSRHLGMEIVGDHLFCLLQEFTQTQRAGGSGGLWTVALTPWPVSLSRSCSDLGNESWGGGEGEGLGRADSLHLVEVVGASVVNVVAEGSGDHGQGLQVCEVSFQLSCLEGQSEVPLTPVL